MSENHSQVTDTEEQFSTNYDNERTSGDEYHRANPSLCSRFVQAGLERDDACKPELRELALTGKG